MKLLYFNPDKYKNFGDELNLWLWSKFLPKNFFDDDDSVVFLGIGTILHVRRTQPFHDRKSRFIVFGSGAGLGTPPVLDPMWNIYFVRGPLTAKALNISPDLAITDPAILLHIFRDQFRGNKQYKFSYMPHVFSGEQEYFKVLLEESGIGLIDPREPIDIVLKKITASGILLTEAMHGAIAADALRVPWIPLQTHKGFTLFKWEDWCSSLELPFRPVQIETSTQKMDYFVNVRSVHGKLGAIRDHVMQIGYLKQKMKKIYDSIKHFSTNVIDRATLQSDLKRIARKTKPFLSSESVMKSRLGQVQEKLECLKRDHANLNDR